MRAWWTEYGRYVIAGVVIAVGGLFGYNQYESSKLNAEVEASMLLETLAEHVNDGELEDAETVAVELVTDYANTAYAAQSRLAMARLYMDKNRDQDAADVLNELLAEAGDQAIKHVARARLARVLLYQGKAQEVVDLLEGQDTAAFAAVYNELLGDAYHALGRIEDAQAVDRSQIDRSARLFDCGFAGRKPIDDDAGAVRMTQTIPAGRPLALRCLGQDADLARGSRPAAQAMRAGDDLSRLRNPTLNLTVTSLACARAAPAG